MSATTKPFRIAPEAYVFRAPGAVGGKLCDYVRCSTCGTEHHIVGDTLRMAHDWFLQHKPRCAPRKNGYKVPRRRSR